MPEFHETGYGRRFYDGQVPKLTATLERCAAALEESNRLKLMEIDKAVQGIKELEDAGLLEQFKEFVKNGRVSEDQTLTRPPFQRVPGVNCNEEDNENEQ